jgi:transposase
MPRVAPRITIDAKARRVLLALIRSPRTRARLKQRCRIILMSAREFLNRDIAEELGLPQVTVGKWRRAFAEKGVAGLSDAPRPGRPPKYDAQFGRRVARELKGAKHRSLRALAQKLGVPPSTLHDIVTQMGLASSLPRRVRNAERLARRGRAENGAKGGHSET